MATKKRSTKAVKKTAKKQLRKISKKRALKPVSRAGKQKKAKKAKAVKAKIAGVKNPEKEKIQLEQKNNTLRKLLIQKREQIVKEAKAEISKYIKGETRQLVDTALDDGDWSIVDLSEDVSLRQLGTHRETLLKIDSALRKLEEGTYGTCEDCGGEISESRLKVVPFAIYCRDCQEKIEQLEAIEKER